VAAGCKGLESAFLPALSRRWRSTLSSLTPPDWLFPVAWTLLYIAIGVAPWLVWRAAGFAGAALPLAVWAVQLLLNAGWSWLFFGLRRMDLAFAEVVALWLSIAAMIALFLPISVTAGLLMIPLSRLGELRGRAESRRVAAQQGRRRPPRARLSACR
jgi:tryptophan-rich sensory protein